MGKGRRGKKDKPVYNRNKKSFGPKGGIDAKKAGVKRLQSAKRKGLAGAAQGHAISRGPKEGDAGWPLLDVGEKPVRAQFRGGGVVVLGVKDSEEDKWASGQWHRIALAGTYGKGTLSRGLPAYSGTVSKREVKFVKRMERPQKLEYYLKHMNEMDESDEFAYRPLIDGGKTLIYESIGNRPKAEKIISRYRTSTVTPGEVAEDGAWVESVQLGLEEAFWLVYAMGALIVEDEDGKALSVEELWEEACSRDPHFPWRYAAYHHYRTKGWIVRSGLKFGFDFVLYAAPPDRSHAEYTITVVGLKESDGSPQSSKTHDESQIHAPCGTLTWATLHTGGRVSENVRKGTLITYVVGPDNGSPEYNSPDVIDKLAVYETVLQRFVPSAHKLNLEAAATAAGPAQ